MNKKIFLTAALGACTMMPALAHAQTDAAPAMSATAASDATVSADDKSFVTNAAEGGMIEIQTSKLAKKMSSSKDIQAFAQHMIEDHKHADDELKSIAKKLNIMVPKQLDAEHKAELNQLKTASKDDFDQKFIAVQDKEHNAAINAFQTEASNGDNAQLKAFAAKTLPTLQGHLADVKTLEQAMPPAATTGTTDTTK